MKVDNLIGRLTSLRKQHGNVDVVISDGYAGAYYQGEFEIVAFVEPDGTLIDIGIGGLNTGENE